MSEAAKTTTEAKKLCNKTAFALEFLYKSKDMSCLIGALADLGAIQTMIWIKDHKSVDFVTFSCDVIPNLNGYITQQFSIMILVFGKFLIFLE